VAARFPLTLRKLEVNGREKAIVRIISLVMLLLVIIAQAVYVAAFGGAGEAVGYVETEIEKLYGSSR
jgi:hypothetical protein